MSYQVLQQELKLKYCAFAISRTIQKDTGDVPKKFPCVNQIFSYVAEHGEVLLTPESISCPGGSRGVGFIDEKPNMPGGFENFITKGAGPGFPAGERIKCSTSIVGAMWESQPKNIMEGFDAVRVAPYCEGDKPDLVSVLANPDQLSALIHLFYFRKSSHDDIIVSVASGCAQVFRIPFGELRKENPKAVMGNVDFFSRPHIDKDLFSLTVSGEAFAQMCEDVAESFLYAPAWNGVKKRL